MSFSVLLKNFREEHHLTQAEVIDKLSLHKPFYRLDKVTYSRWENGHSSPPLYKQFKVLDLLGDCSLLVKLSRETLYMHETLVPIIKKRFSGNSAVFGDYFYAVSPKTELKVKSQLDDVNPVIVHAYLSKYGHNLQSILDLARGYKMKKFSTLEYYNNSRLVGHSVLMVLNFEAIKVVMKTLSVEYRENVVEEMHISDRQEIIFMTCCYSSSPAVYCDSLLSTIKVFEDKGKYPEFIYFRIQNNVSKTFLDALDIRVVSFGPRVDDGVKHMNKSYQWVGVLIPTSNVLSCIGALEKIITESGECVGDSIAFSDYCCDC